MPINLLGGGAGGGGMGKMLPLLGMQMGANMASGGQKSGSPISGAIQNMMPMLQAKKEEEMWEMLKKRLAQQGLQQGDASRMASPGVQAGGAGPPMGDIY